LIVKNGFITDTSSANILFYDGRDWVTPSTPLLMGTCREKLLRGGKIREENIKRDDIYKFKHFRLINAMIGENLLPIPIINII
jgi:4-amino-4-deoxychorismate lyase